MTTPLLRVSPSRTNKFPSEAGTTNPEIELGNSTLIQAGRARRRSPNGPRQEGMTGVRVVSDREASARNPEGGEGKRAGSRTGWWMGTKKMN